MTQFIRIKSIDLCPSNLLYRDAERVVRFSLHLCLCIEGSVSHLITLARHQIEALGNVRIVDS